MKGFIKVTTKATSEESSYVAFLNVNEIEQIQPDGLGVRIDLKTIACFDFIPYTNGYDCIYNHLSVVESVDIIENLIEAAQK